jgi:hypothetical protein
VRPQTPIEEALLDDFIAALATPVPERPPLVDRVGTFGRELTSSPRRAAAVTAWLFALAAALLSTVRTSVAVRTSLGPAHARCGLDAFFGGARDPAVGAACRHAEATRLVLFVPAVAVVLAGLVLAAGVVVRRGRRTEGSRGAAAVDKLRSHPWHAAAIAAGILALPVGAVALRPVVVERPGSGGLVTAHCGVDTYLFGYPERAVQNACRHAYGGHAHILAGVALLVALGAVAAVLVAVAGRKVARARFVLTTIGVMAGAVALIALRPVNVVVDVGEAPIVAHCGIDTYLVGHPDRAVESACRRHVRTHAAVAAASAALALVTLAAARVDVVTRRLSDQRRPAVPPRTQPT